MEYEMTDAIMTWQEINIYAWTVFSPLEDNPKHVNTGIVFAGTKDAAGKMLDEFGIDTSKIGLNWVGKIKGDQVEIDNKIIQIS